MTRCVSNHKHKKRNYGSVTSAEIGILWLLEGTHGTSHVAVGNLCALKVSRTHFLTPSDLYIEIPKIPYIFCYSSLCHILQHPKRSFGLHLTILCKARTPGKSRKGIQVYAKLYHGKQERWKESERSFGLCQTIPCEARTPGKSQKGVSDYTKLCEAEQQYSKREF